MITERQIRDLETFLDEHGWNSLDYFLQSVYMQRQRSVRSIGVFLTLSDRQVKHLLQFYGIKARPRGRPGSLEGTDMEGTLKSVSEETGIPKTTLHYRRKVKELEEMHKSDEDMMREAAKVITGVPQRSINVSDEGVTDSPPTPGEGTEGHSE